MIIIVTIVWSFLGLAACLERLLNGHLHDDNLKQKAYLFFIFGPIVWAGTVVYLIHKWIMNKLAQDKKTAALKD